MMMQIQNENFEKNAFDSLIDDEKLTIRLSFAIVDCILWNL